MPIERKTLDAIALAYVGAMTSIRGRRVHRLLMREFARFDHVLPAVAEDGSPAVLALAADGGAAVCATDGRGAAAAIAEVASLDGAAVLTAYDLLRDSLPVVGWTIRHPGFAHLGGALTIAADGRARDECVRIAGLLRAVGKAAA